MISRLTLRGGAGASLVCGHRTAVVLRTWAITRESQLAGGDGKWRLSATIARVDKLAIRFRPLLFTAPRPGGMFCFPVEDLELGESGLLARLGPPEH